MESVSLESWVGLKVHLVSLPQGLQSNILPLAFFWFGLCFKFQVVYLVCLHTCSGLVGHHCFHFAKGWKSQRVVERRTEGSKFQASGLLWLTLARFCRETAAASLFWANNCCIFWQRRNFLSGNPWWLFKVLRKSGLFYPHLSSISMKFSFVCWTSPVWWWHCNITVYCDALRKSLFYEVKKNPLEKTNFFSLSHEALCESTNQGAIITHSSYQPASSFPCCTPVNSTSNTHYFKCSLTFPLF